MNKRDYIIKLFYLNICNVSIDEAIILRRFKSKTANNTNILFRFYQYNFLNENIS